MIAPNKINDKVYLELRYNYDADKTLGLYSGRQFMREEKVKHTLTPQIGVLLGDKNGTSLQLYYRLEYKGFNLNFQNQYTIFKEKYENGFYYNWTSAEATIFKQLSGGISTQLYLSTIDNYSDNGLFLVLKNKTKTLGIYTFYFNPYSQVKQYLFFGFYKIFQCTKKQPT